MSPPRHQNMMIPKRESSYFNSDVSLYLPSNEHKMTSTRGGDYGSLEKSPLVWTVLVENWGARKTESPMFYQGKAMVFEGINQFHPDIITLSTL